MDKSRKKLKAAKARNQNQPKKPMQAKQLQQAKQKQKEWNETCVRMPGCESTYSTPGLPPRPPSTGVRSTKLKTCAASLRD